jgi:hypothetical protein
LLLLESILETPGLMPRLMEVLGPKARSEAPAPNKVDGKARRPNGKAAGERGQRGLMKGKSRLGRRGELEAQ